MRLVRLEMKGFGAFRHPTELDFDDADFFALVGPTGAGKSTVLDAVCFALYGSVPRYDDEKLISPVLTLGASEAKVRLDFELGGGHYIATRVARRTPKGATTKEARLERVISGDDTDVLANGGPEVSAEVRRLLGLRFEDFTRCVALPQGDFARFLRGKVDERRDLMLRLLNLGVYREVGERARRQADEARIKMESHDRQLAELEWATAEALDGARVHRAAVDELHEDVEKMQPRLADLAAEEHTARQQAKQARSNAALLATIAVPDEVREFAVLHQRAQERHAREEKTADELTKRREVAQQERALLPELGVLQSVRNAHDELADCDRKIAHTETQLEELTKAETGLLADLETAKAALQAAVAEQRAVERQHQALALAGSLVVGEPCPVCDQVVDRLPEREPVAALAGAELNVTTAEETLGEKQRQHTKTTNLLAGTTEKLEWLRSRRKELVLVVEPHPDVTALDALIGQVREAESAVRDALDKERGAREEVRKAKAALDGLKEGAQQARSRFAAQRDTVAAVGPPGAGPGDDVLADWTALAAWAEGLIPAQRELAATADREADGYRKTGDEVLDRLRQSLHGLQIPVAVDADPIAIMKATVKAATEAAQATERIEREIAQTETLREQRAQLDEERKVAKLLGDLMRADEFPQWLVEEALQLLTVDASEILRDLTGGQFSLAVGEKEFVVVDHVNADERRPARTLSGGETFQASLALALALSQQIRDLAAEGAPRLDAIFLDEGFGSLDPDTLDVVATTIENLGQTGRMVGVVTHVSELAARVPVYFKVSKAQGSSVVEKHYA
jgi:exonuclease SbcC